MTDDHFHYDDHALNYKGKALRCIWLDVEGLILCASKDDSSSCVQCPKTPWLPVN